jgi:hypothetical protein
MAQFDAVLPALMQGQSVRRGEWEPVVRIFVVDDILMCQCGDLSPWLHSLTWCEIIASDWQLVEVASTTVEKRRIAAGSVPVWRVPWPILRGTLNKEKPLSTRPFFRHLYKWWEAE